MPRATLGVILGLSIGIRRSARRLRHLRSRPPSPSWILLGEAIPPTPFSADHRDMFSG